MWIFVKFHSIPIFSKWVVDMSYRRKKERMLQEEFGPYEDLEYRLATGQISTHEYWRELEKQYVEQYHYVSWLDQRSV